MSEIRVYIGLIRCGKTTHAVKQAQLFHKKYPDSPVYTNIPELSGCFFIDFYSFDKYRVHDRGTGHALFLLDEACVEMNNREFKRFPKASRDWLSMSGHEKCDLYVYSQAVDFDATVMHKACVLYTLKKFGPWTIARRWLQSFQPDEKNSGAPVPTWTKDIIPIDFKESVFRPRWYKYFNSWWSPFEGLPDVPDEFYIPFPDETSPLPD